MDQAARLIEAERAQIANEIHDGVLPLLFAASASLSGLIEHSGEDAFNTAHRAALAPFRQPDGGFRIAARFRCLVATPGA